ncbi:hypothetical protein L1987_07052 [Smallanthus sonchifolius]|uniref:Uncharacterized protein n=1 Tax=Smallanthus sonchifolius TaxID=185202 RepID=A0ACB9JZZ1_9ASTR|nr:hypothetical protein L1987_07052 [Smallanthus sonchifolius]
MAHIVGCPVQGKEEKMENDKREAEIVVKKEEMKQMNAEEKREEMIQSFMAQNAHVPAQTNELIINENDKIKRINNEFKKNEVVKIEATMAEFSVDKKLDVCSNKIDVNSVYVSSSCTEQFSNSCNSIPSVSSNCFVKYLNEEIPTYSPVKYEPKKVQKRMKCQSLRLKMLTNLINIHLKFRNQLLNAEFLITPCERNGLALKLFRVLKPQTKKHDKETEKKDQKIEKTVEKPNKKKDQKTNKNNDKKVYHKVAQKSKHLESSSSRSSTTSDVHSNQ